MITKLHNKFHSISLAINFTVLVIFTWMWSDWPWIISNPLDGFML